MMNKDSLYNAIACMEEAVSHLQAIDEFRIQGDFNYMITNFDHFRFVRKEAEHLLESLEGLSV